MTPPDQLPAILQPGAPANPVDGHLVPALIADAGEPAAWRYIEFFTANIRNPNTRRAYARADFWEERVRMMTWWAERCEEMRRGGVVVALRA